MKSHIKIHILRFFIAFFFLLLLLLRSNTNVFFPNENNYFNSSFSQLQETSFEILRSLPEMGIFPGTEVYNQFLEHYARTHDFRQTKNVLRLMSQSKPRAKPDVVSYGYLIR